MGDGHIVVAPQYQRHGTSNDTRAVRQHCCGFWYLQWEPCALFCMDRMFSSLCHSLTLSGLGQEYLQGLSAPPGYEQRLPCFPLLPVCSRDLRLGGWTALGCTKRWGSSCSSCLRRRWTCHSLRFLFGDDMHGLPTASTGMGNTDLHRDHLDDSIRRLKKSEKGITWCLFL